MHTYVYTRTCAQWPAGPTHTFSLILPDQGTRGTWGCSLCGAALEEMAGQQDTGAWLPRGRVELLEQPSVAILVFLSGEKTVCIWVGYHCGFSVTFSWTQSQWNSSPVSLSPSLSEMVPQVSNHHGLSCVTSQIHTSKS